MLSDAKGGGVCSYAAAFFATRGGYVNKSVQYYKIQRVDMRKKRRKKELNEANQKG